MLRRPRQVATAALAATLLAATLIPSAAAHEGSVLQDLVRAAIATAPFHSTKLAGRAGYGPFPKGAPLHECISSLDGTGAMGFHWLDADNLSTHLDVRKPQVLVYAPDRHGRLHLVALEYVVFKADWDAAHPGTTPMLFEQMFMETGFPNRYAIPAFYSLHVWLWRYNPSGLFAPFNPRVSCDPGRKHADAGTPASLASIDADVTAARGAASRFACAIRSA